MSIAKLFEKVFGEDIFEQRSEEPSDELENCAEHRPGYIPPATTSTAGKEKIPNVLATQLVTVKAWLQTKLDTIDANCTTAIRLQNDPKTGRIGPEMTIFDIDFTSTVRISTDRLSVRSQGSFNTIKANVCVYDGRWMYEIHLHSKGVMQIGWASALCNFNENSGVGDSKYSYGYDGSKQQMWHIWTKKYGDKWQIGDIIGVTLDVEKESIEYFRNGKSMGVAFNKLERGPGITFFAAVSLGYNQSIHANFGNTPFSYPVVGYSPLQSKPIAKLQQTAVLMDYLVNLSDIIAKQTCCSIMDAGNELKENLVPPKESAASRKEHRDSKETMENGSSKEFRIHKFSSKKAVYVVFATLLIEKLTPLIFDSYVVSEKFILYLTSLCNTKNESHENSPPVPGTPASTLGAMLSLFWSFMDAEEIKCLLRKIINVLLNTYTSTHPGMDYSRQQTALHLLTCLCRHKNTRKCFLEQKFFKKHCLALFMYIRPPEFSYMQQVIPNSQAWTEGVGGNKTKYLATVEKLAKDIEPLYEQQMNLIMILLNNDDGDEKTPSSRKLFLRKLRRYVMDVSLEQRPFQSFFLMQSSIQIPIEAQVSLSFMCILVDVSRVLFETEMHGTNVSVDPKYFIDGSFEYQHFDRLGGVLSHLRKVHRSEINNQLGPERTQELMEEDRVVMRVGEIDPSIFLTTTNLNNITIIGRTQGNINTPFTHYFNPRVNQPVEVSPGGITCEASLFEMLDVTIIFYYSVGHKYIVKIATTRDEIAALNDTLNETKYYREDVERKLKVLEAHASVCMDEKHSHVVTELRSKFGQRENVFAKRSIDLARKQAWYRAVALGRKRRLLLVWLLEKILTTLNNSSDMGSLFAFVPEIYINILPILLDSVMDFSFHDLVTQYDIADAECVINSSAEFLALHSADPRIVLASCKDSLLQALGTLTCHKGGIVALERASRKSQLALVRALLRPYENRAWGQSNWLLLRFWLGEGFAFRDSRLPSIWQGGNEPYSFGLCRSRAKNETHTGLLHHIAPAHPSRYYQRIIGQRLTDDEPFATIFLNSVLSQLNWAFSEFILLLQEIQNTAHRQENTVFEPKQLKICSMCFELTVSLMRCLEMVISIAPDIFKDPSRPNSDLILNRVCQLISQVLSRVTVPPGCFQFVVDMCSPDLSSVTHFPIITAAVGILLALMRSEMETDKHPAKVTRITRALLTDPSFQFANLEFALGEIKTPILQQTEIPRGNFDPSTRAHIDPLTNDVRMPVPSTSTKRIRASPPILKFTLSDYPSHVSSKDIEDVKKLIEMLRMKQSLLSDITLPSEDSLCPICCAKPITVMFTPCKHQSCSNCIMQHLMNSKLCFYCKTFIETIEQTDGTVIYQNAENIPSPTLFEQI